MEAPGTIPENLGVLRYLAEDAEPSSVSIEPAGAETDTWRLGAHPDVVERLWTDLVTAVPGDSRFLVAGGAALIDPTTGHIVALALGTQYALRLGGAALDESLAAGYRTVHEFRTVARTLDLAATFGRGWVFGRHDHREPDWLARSLRGDA